ncbi:MAG: hypothetical protein ABSC72_06820 [Methylovirgula sp.]|jgi:hypothetical protein
MMIELRAMISGDHRPRFQLNLLAVKDGEFFLSSITNDMRDARGLV